jgi:putative endonuclease
MRPDKRTTWKQGIWAEYVAAAVLWLKGYRIRAMRYKTPVGEVDIIASRGRALVFVEVKKRSGHEQAAEAIHVRNRQRIVRAAQHYIMEHPDMADRDMRFDAVVINSSFWPRHLDNAWDGNT